MDRRVDEVGSGWIYIVGMLVWLVWWVVICWARGFINRYFDHPLFFVPIMICLIILGVNWWIWRKPRSYENYAQEVKVIEFVERNAGWLILAITVAIIAIQPLMSKKDIYGPVINYQLWALIFAILTLALIWIPSDRSDWLVRLRHIKTIFFSYAISWFIAGIIAFWRRYTYPT